ACTRFAADLVAAMGTLAEICERLLNNFLVLRLKPLLGSVLGEKLLTKVITWIGRVKFLGSLAGIVGVAWDLYHAIDDIRKGNVGSGIAYLISAISGLVLIIFSLGPVGIVITLLFFFGANIYLEMKKKNEIQKWLMACLWRKIPAGEEDVPVIWPDSRMEMDAFNKLMTSAEA
ncbi:hypothetical protein AM629_21525, partial [Photorhabdus heterorhabditis]